VPCAHRYFFLLFIFSLDYVILIEETSKKDFYSLILPLSDLNEDDPNSSSSNSADLVLVLQSRRSVAEFDAVSVRKSSPYTTWQRELVQKRIAELVRRALDPLALVSPQVQQRQQQLQKNASSSSLGECKVREDLSKLNFGVNSSGNIAKEG
jgi:hypothetical protein